MQNKENQNETVPAKNQKQKTKQNKKKGKVAEVYAMHQKGVSVKDIAQKMKLSEAIVRSYVWRAGNPEKYKSLLKRYHEKKKARLANNKSKNSAEKV